MRIVVTGLIAQHPRLGGVAWDYVQYPMGLAGMGHDVHYLEDSGEWPYVLDGGGDHGSWVAPDARTNADHLRRVMARAGLGDRWMYRSGHDGAWYGLDAARRRRVLGAADLVLNVSGALEHPERYRGAATLVYVDSDPAFTQARLVADPGGPFRARVDAHDVHFSFGERIGAGPFHTGHRWLPTRQPVVLDAWETDAPAGDAFTTVMSWTSYPPLRAGGLVLGQKDAEFRHVLTLPRRTGAALEVALGSLQHAGWQTASSQGLPDDLAALVRDDPATTPAALLRRAGWRVVDALRRCASTDAYRAYVQGSRAELSVAKAGYVASRCGWFSCRSACYLAAGRPVVVQDTGFADVIPVGDGVLGFADGDGALAGVEEVLAHPARHARAAREIAAEYFGAERVLSALLERATTAAPAGPAGGAR